MKRLWCVSLLLISLHYWNVFSNDSAMRINMNSGTVFPVNNEYIRMVEEEVVFKDHVVTTTFIFENTSTEPQDVIIGFPFTGDINKVGLYMPSRVKDPLEEGPDRWQKIIKYHDFKCYIDGKKVVRVLKKSVKKDSPCKEYNYWFITDLHFDANEKKEVINTYKQLPTGREDFTMSRFHTMKYILKTGKLWKGTIGKASITFNIPFLPSSPFNIPQYPDNNIPHLMYMHDEQVLLKDMQMVFDFAGIIENGIPGYQMGRFSTWSNKEPETVTAKGKYLEIKWSYTDFEPDFDIICTWGLDLHIDWMYMPGLSGLSTKENNYNKYLNNKEFFYKLTLAAGACVMNMCHCCELIPEKYAKDEKKKLLALSQFFVASLYAHKGYIFKDGKWRNLFKKFTWYKPVTTSPVFTPEEKEAIELVKKNEKFIRDLL